MNQQLGSSSTCYLLPPLLSVLDLEAFNATTFIRAIDLHPEFPQVRKQCGLPNQSCSTGATLPRMGTQHVLKIRPIYHAFI